MKQQQEEANKKPKQKSKKNKRTKKGLTLQKNSVFFKHHQFAF